MAEEWLEKVFEMQRVSGRIIIVKLIVGQCVIIVFVCVCLTEWFK